MTQGASIPARHGPAARAGDARLAWRDVAADASVLATFAAVLALFLLSAITLEAWGIPYLSPGGGVLSKLHPATFISAIAIGLRCLATRHPVRAAWRLATNDAGIVLLGGATVVLGIIAVIFMKTPVTPMIDTFLLPIMIFVLLRDLDTALVRRLAILITVILCANSIVALMESVGGWHLIHIDVPDGFTADPTQGNAVFSWQAQFYNEWRATALFGHPLVNGLVVGAFLLCLAAESSRWIPSKISLPLGGLQLASMFTFGARTALVLTITLGAVLLLQRTVSGLGRGFRLEPRIVAIALLGIAVMIAGAGAMFQTGFFDHTIERFAQDQGSAETRVTMIDLFTSIPLGDLLLVPDPDVVATLQRVYGLEFGIESSWIGLALNYGLIPTTMILASLVAFSRSVARVCGNGATVVLIFYFILASVAAQMSTKTTTLAMTICLILVYLPLDTKRRLLNRAPA